MSEKSTWKKSTTWLQDHIKQNPWIKRLQSYMLNTIEKIYNENPVKAQMLIEYYEYGTTKSSIDVDTLSQFQLVEYYINKLNPNNYRLTDEIVPLIKEYLEIGEINQNTKDLVAKAFEESDDFDEDMFETISTTRVVGCPSELMSHTIRRKPDKINTEPQVVDKPEFEFYE